MPLRSSARAWTPSQRGETMAGMNAHACARRLGPPLALALCAVGCGAAPRPPVRAATPPPPSTRAGDAPPATGDADRLPWRVLVVTTGNLLLEGALQTAEELRIESASPDSAPARLRAGSFRVVVFDGVTEPLTAGVGAVYLHAEGENSPLDVDGAEVRDPRVDDVERGNPLLEGVGGLEDVAIESALRYRLRRGDRAIVSAAGVPLVIVGTRDGHRFVALAFDPRKSDLPLRASWPALLRNAALYCAGHMPAR